MHDYKAMRDYLLACADEPERIPLWAALGETLEAMGEGKWEVFDASFGTVRIHIPSKPLTDAREEPHAD